MKFVLYDYVKIRNNGLSGQIIDMTERNGETVYTVECDEKGYCADANYPALYSLYDCKENEIEKTLV